MHVRPSCSDFFGALLMQQSQGFVGSETPRFAERGHAVQPGKCRRECRTMARMCEDIVGDHDTDLAELLLANPGRATVEQQLCYDLSSACVQKPPQFSGPRPDGEDFEEIDTEELGMLRMMATMQDQGMSGNVRCCCCAVSCPQMLTPGTDQAAYWYTNLVFLTAVDRPGIGNGADERVPAGDGGSRNVGRRHFKSGWRDDGRGRAVTDYM